jgi:tetratricopeptide (TPR) repeat protein
MPSQTADHTRQAERRPQPGPAEPRRETRAAARQRARGAPARAPLFAWPTTIPALESLAHAPWLLPAVLGLAVVLRAAHLLALQHSPFAISLVLDARYYDAWAREIAAGGVIGKAPAWVDPLYAYVLGALYAVGGHDLLLARIANMVFGLATVYLVARLAERVWQSRAAALLAALMALLCVPTLYYEGQTEKTALTVLVLTAAVERFVAGSVFAAGVLTGLATLARGNALIFVPFGALALVLGWVRGRGQADDAPLAARARCAAVFAVCALPIIGLATLHNWLAAREFVLTTTNLGVNLYLGNHAGNAYGYYSRPDFVQPATGDELPDFRAEAERRLERTLTDREISDYWRDQAVDAVLADPGLALVRTVRKLRLALHNDEAPDNEAVQMVAEWSPVLRSPVFWVGQLLALGVLGVAIGWRRRGVRILAGVIAVYLASLLPFFVMGRLRVQMVPLLCVLGAGAGVGLIGLLGARDGRRLAAAGTVLAALLLVTYYRPEWMARHRNSSLAIVWNNLGYTLLGAQDETGAIRAFERAVAVSAESVPASLRALGDLYRKRGDFVRAEAAMRRVLEIKPGSPSGIAALRSLYAAMLQDPRWRDDQRLRARAQALGGPTAAAPADPARAALAQARALGAQGKHAEAIAVLEEAVRTGPYDENLHYVLGETLERHGTPEEMIRFFSEELARDQKPQTSHYFWAVGLARQGDIEGAIARLQKALEVDPAHEMSQRQWGLLLERQGRLAEALEHLVEATRIHADFRAAFEDAARVAEKLGRQADADSYRRRAATADPNSIRRFLHWARYLHEHGRDQAAWAELQHMLRARPNDPDALKLRDEIRAALAQAGLPVPAAAPATPPPAAAEVSGDLTAAGRAALVGRLREQPPATTWIAYDGRDAGAQRLATALAAAFEEARWRVGRLAPVKFAPRPGLFVMVADQPSERTRAVGEALTRAGLAHQTGTEYRAYSEERRRADPSWQGIEFAPGQEFVILVGRPQ